MNQPQESPAALQGIVVVELTQALAGPYLAMLLGDLGADVIKVERPGSGDQSRGWGPPFADTESAYFMAVNRNKRSFTCNFRSPRGLEALRRLVDRADVVITNERRESYRHNMGIDYERLSKRNPGVVYCSITGFGMTGPYSGRSGYDIVAQGLAGLMPITGEKGSAPMRYPASIADLATALYGTISVLAALLARQATGRGQYVDLSLLESQSWWGVTQAVAYLLSGRPPRSLGNDHPFIVPYGAFKASDGYVIIGCGSEPLWHALCKVLDLGHVRDDPRYHINRERVQRRDDVRALIEERMASRTVAEWCALLSQDDIPSSPIYDIPSMLRDEHMLSRGFVVEQQHPTAGLLRTLASPLHLSETPASYRLAPPLLGQHTDEILAELGFTPEEIAGMHKEGAV